MRRTPIRVKLAVALTVPLIAVGLVTLIEVMDVAGDARDVQAQADLATATIGPNGLITALQNERNWTSAHLVGVEDQVATEVVGYDATRAETDAALAQFEAELDDRGEAARAAYAPALEGLARLRDLRREIDPFAAAADRTLDNMPLTTEIFDRYTDLIVPFFDGMSRISIVIDDPVLRQGAQLMETVTRQLEIVPQLANALALPANVSTGPGDIPGVNSPAEIAEVAQLRDSLMRQADELRNPTGRYAPVAEEYFPEEFNRVLDEQSVKAITTGTVDVNALLAGLDLPADQAYLGYSDQVAAALQGRADELHTSSEARQRRFGLLMGVTFTAAVALTVLVSLSITRPLRSLTRQAKEMAERRLPGAVATILDTPLGEDVRVPSVTPVRVATRDEVADVAEALNTVQESALDLAVEQAVLRRNIADSFVNLGRRNQNLLGRQLDFITELESNETDPDTLASLFRLDHLATRMRRNAESLLVLAGIEPPRQWAAPVAVTDVIRAALGEVENYQRVAMRGVAPATVVGSAAADLAHLLAELIENALMFSPPDRSVDVRGTGQSQRRTGGYTLTIADASLGMTPEDVEAANRRLAGIESFTVAPSKYLGHYVAGNLAARHGISVHLRSTPGAGVTASVDLPPELLTGDAGAGPGGAATFATAPAPAPAPSPAPGMLVAPGAPPGHPPAAPHTGSSPATRTLSGLPRRAPLDRGALPATGLGPTDEQLASLARVAGRSGGRTPPAAPARPVAGGPGVGRAASAAPGPGPLTRRNPGAQMPSTAPLGLRRRGGGGESRPASAAPPPRPSRAADEVYGFLSSFTAGVQRGIDEARAAGRPDHSGWHSGNGS